jgi:hypothetical protein
MGKVSETITAALDACKKAATDDEPDKALKFAQAAATVSTPSIKGALSE